MDLYVAEGVEVRPDQKDEGVFIITLRVLAPLDGSFFSRPGAELDFQVVEVKAVDGTSRPGLVAWLCEQEHGLFLVVARGPSEGLSPGDSLEVAWREILWAAVDAAPEVGSGPPEDA